MKLLSPARRQTKAEEEATARREAVLANNARVLAKHGVGKALEEELLRLYHESFVSCWQLSVERDIPYDDMRVVLRLA